MIGAASTVIGYILTGVGLIVFCLVTSAGTWAGIHTPARARYRSHRRTPRFDHECDPMRDLAPIPGAEDERKLGLWIAHRELEAAAERCGRTAA